MSKKKKGDIVAVSSLADDALLNNFLRGFIATGVLAALQDRRREPLVPIHVLGRALQGGAALATGVATANALQRGDYARAAGAALLGMTGVGAVEYLMNHCEDLTAERMEE